MKFAQCPTDVSELEVVRQRRDQRAKLRAEGLRLTRTLVAAAASPPAKVIAKPAQHFLFLLGRILSLVAYPGACSFPDCLMLIRSKLKHASGLRTMLGSH